MPGNINIKSSIYNSIWFQYLLYRNKVPTSSKTLLLTTTTTTVAAATAATITGLSNGDSSNYNNQQQPQASVVDAAGSLGHSLLTDGVSCLSLPTSQQQPTGHQNKIKVFIYLFFWYYNKQQPSSIELQKNIAIYISFLSTITQWRLLCLGVCVRPARRLEPSIIGYILLTNPTTSWSHI